MFQRMTGRTEYRIGVWLLGGTLGLACAALVWAQDSPEDPAEKPASYVGSEPCKVCHPQLSDAWSTSAHGAALTTDSLPTGYSGCEACHGPGGRHVGSGAKNKPTVPKADDAAETNALCGKCHFKGDSTKAPQAWQNLSGKLYVRNMHGRKGVSCVSCHSGHAGENDHALAKPAEELCLDCHASVMESSPGKKAAYTHSPVALGQCVLCHDPHGTRDRRMVRDDLYKVCQKCHDPVDPAVVAAHPDYPIADANCLSCHDPHSHNQKTKLIEGKKHGPFKQGNCKLCHVESAEGQRAELVKPADKLCFSCHPAASLVRKNEKAHPPVEAGFCLMCHDPHVSKRKGMLKTRVANACFACHRKVEDDTLAVHKHAIVDANLDCLLCHKPHSSKEDKLLVKDEMTLCGQCHEHTFSHPMGDKEDGSPVIDPTTGERLVCSGCHTVHGGKHPSITTEEKSRELCVRCHSKLEH